MVEVHEVGRDDLKRRAKKLLSDKGWTPGNLISAHSAIELMTALAIDAVENPPDRCGWPECGCCHDASCNEARIRAALAPASEPVGWRLVPVDALRWLNGEHEDGFEKPEAAKGNFWWRSEFKRRCAAAPPAPAPEASDER